MAGMALKQRLRDRLLCLDPGSLLDLGEAAVLGQSWRSVSIRAQLRVPLAPAAAVFYHFKTLGNAASINPELRKSAKEQQPYLN